jgi:AraC-like DNA-binding protein
VPCVESIPAMQKANLSKINFFDRKFCKDRLGTRRLYMRRIHPILAPSGTFNGKNVRGELFVFTHFDAADMEFSQAPHVIIILPDGVYGSWENDSGDHIDQFRLMAPITIISNPVRKYLHFRMTKAQDQWRVLLLTIEPAVLTALGEDDLEQLIAQFCAQIGMDDPAISQALAAIQEEIEKPSFNSGLYEESFLTLTLIRLLKYQLKRAAKLPHDYIRGGLANWRLKRALQLIENNSGKMPALSEIADAVSLRVTSFCRAFKQSTGQSPHHYLLVHRVNRAKGMMQDPNRTLTDIALDCGFSGPSQFSVVFRRIVGRSPRSYRDSL